MNKLDILYEDNHIIVVVKPNNVLSQGDDTNDLDMLTMIKSYIKEKYNKSGNVYIGLVHRLDRPVSGVMVFAKTSKAASRLSEGIRNNSFKKEYLAVISGVLPIQEDNFTDYLLKLKSGNTIVTDEENGKLSKLSYRVLDVNKKANLSLVLVNLETGRHHQIRVQFSSRGYPIYGDQRYGKSDNKPIALHAYQISFIHPTTKEELIFSKLPNKIDTIWNTFDCKIKL